MDLRLKTGLFLASAVLVSLCHFAPRAVWSVLLDVRARRLKNGFNRMLAEGCESEEKLRMLKTLINNISHCPGQDVLLHSTLDEVRKAYAALRVANKPVFLRLSDTYNMAVFVPVLFPILVQSVELLRLRNKC